MPEFFNGRALTENEAFLRSQERCIACGQKAKRTKRKDQPEVVEFECLECMSSRTNYGTGAGDTPREDFGAGRASVGSAFRSLMGYGPQQGASPEVETEDPGPVPDGDLTTKVRKKKVAVPVKEKPDRRTKAGRKRPA